MFSTSWKYDHHGCCVKKKHFLYITGKAIYLYNYLFFNKRYDYIYTHISSDWNVGLSCYTGNNCYYTFSYGKHSLWFSYDPDGLAQAEKVYIVLTMAVNSINNKILGG